MTHYPARPQGNVSENTEWTQSRDARKRRAMAVSCMPRNLLDVFPDDLAFSKRWALESCTPEQQRAWRDIVGLLQQIGLLSTTTAAVDVNVPRMVREAREINAEIDK